jgi:hypothetical protein
LKEVEAEIAAMRKIRDLTAREYTAQAYQRGKAQ